MHHLGNFSIRGVRVGPSTPRGAPPAPARPSRSRTARVARAPARAPAPPTRRDTRLSAYIINLLRSSYRALVYVATEKTNSRCFFDRIRCRPRWKVTMVWERYSVLWRLISVDLSLCRLLRRAALYVHGSPLLANIFGRDRRYFS